MHWSSEPGCKDEAIMVPFASCPGAFLILDEFLFLQSYQADLRNSKNSFRAVTLWLRQTQSFSGLPDVFVPVALLV